MIRACIVVSVFAACVSPPPDPQMPTVKSTSVDGSPVAASPDGSYMCTVKFSYGDDVNVVSYEFVIGPSMLTGQIATPQHNGNETFNVVLAAGTPSGTIPYTVTITDAMSRMSDDGEGTVVLSPP